MFENKTNTAQQVGPFNIIYNYRSVSTRSSKVSKKHGIRKLSQVPIDLGVKKNRKMTENIEVGGILQEMDLQAEVRCTMSQAQMESQRENNCGFDWQNCQHYDSPDLQKVIPVELQEHQLDQQTPFELSSFRNIYCSFQQELLGKKQ